MAKKLSKKVPKEPRSVAQLPLPIVECASSNNTLDPMLVLQGAKVTVAFEGMSRDHEIQLCWVGPPGPGRPTLPVQNGSDSGSIEIEIDISVVGACIGRTVPIWYTATRNGKTETSLTLELTVQTIESKDLPAPEFLDVSTENGTRWLDMRKFAGDVRVHLNPWPLMAQGQRLWILAVGNQHHIGNYRFEWVLVNHRVTALDIRLGFSEVLSRLWAGGNEDYSSITLQAAVTFDAALGELPADPTVSLLPPNALELRFTSENLRVGEPELHLLAPSVLEATECGAEGCLLNPINAKDGATIRVAYEGMAQTDWVCAYFEGTAGTGTPSLACKYGSNNGFVDFPVPASAISANLCKSVTVRYTVLRDTLWSSLPLTLKVLNLTDLPTPEVTQVTGGELDLRTFSGNAECTVAPWWFITEGQPTWLWVTGELEDGTPHSFDVLMGQGLPASGEDDGVTSCLPRHELEKLADCSKCQVRFAVNFNGQIDQPSAVKFPLRELTVHQQDLKLIPPIVLEAARNFLNPENAREGVIVQVKYDRISPRHTIELHWVRPDGTSLSIEDKQGNGVPGYVEFKVPLNEVIACIGKTVSLSYTVTSQCKQAISLDLNLNVLVPKNWPKLVLIQATNNILDLSNFFGDATVKVKPWAPWMVEGQRIWLTGTGTHKNGAVHTFEVTSGDAVTADEVMDGLVRTVKRADLDVLLDKSSLRFTCFVSLDGSHVREEAVVLPILHLTVRAVPEIHYENFDGQPNQFISGGQSIDNPALKMKIRLLAGSHGRAGIMTPGGAVSGMLSGPAIVMAYALDHANPEQRVWLDFRAPYRRVKFAYTHNHRPSRIIFYDESYNVMDELYFQGQYNGGLLHSWVDVSAPLGKCICFVELVIVDYSFLDYFTLWE